MTVTILDMLRTSYNVVEFVEVAFIPLQHWAEIRVLLQKSYGNKDKKWNSIIVLRSYSVY